MNKIKRNQISVIFVVTIVITLVLSACGGAETPDPTAPPPAAPTETAPPPGPTPDPSIPVAVIPTPAPGDPAAIANYNTIIFSGPGEDYVVYATFLGAQTAQVVGKSENSQWWAISVPVSPEGKGWVSASWVTVANTDNVAVLPAPPVPPTTDLVPPGPDDPQVISIANVYVRTGPGTSYPAYGIAPAGVSGHVLGKSEDGSWWVVRLNPENVGAGYGWVDAQYTQATNVAEVQTIQNPEQHSEIPPQAPPSGVPVATAADYVNVRTGPGVNYTTLGVAAPGASAEVSGQSADGAWWQVNIPTVYTPTGLGWVSASYVTTQNTENVPIVEGPAPPQTVPPAPPPPSSEGCLLVSQDPVDGTVFGAGTSFNTNWVLQNSGSEGWVSGEYDIAFVGAVNNIYLHQGADLYDLASTVEPGSTYAFTVPMIAPFDPGTYGEQWQVVRGNQSVCQFYVYIKVE